MLRMAILAGLVVLIIGAAFGGLQVMNEPYYRGQGRAIGIAGTVLGALILLLLKLIMDWMGVREGDER